MSRALGGTLLTTSLADQDLAGGDLLQAGDHAQQRGLAAAGGTDQDDELAVVDGYVHAVDHLVRPNALRTCLSSTEAMRLAELRPAR